jgi:hypothetical protein
MARNGEKCRWTTLIVSCDLIRRLSVPAKKVTVFCRSLATFVGYHALSVCQLRRSRRAAPTPILLGCWAGGLRGTLRVMAASRISAGVLPMLVLEGGILVLAYLHIFVSCRVQSVNATLYRLLTAPFDRIRLLPAARQCQCLAQHIIFALRTLPARETIKCG